MSGQDELGMDPETIRRLERLAIKQITPRPATANPQIDRSVNKLDKLGFRDEINKSDIQPMGMLDFKSGSNTLGETDMKNNIMLNPHALALYPDIKNTATLAHELTHVRQNLSTPNPSDKFDRENILPYDERPSEIEAFKAGHKYEESLPTEERRRQYAFPMPTSFFDALPKFIPISEYKGFKDLIKDKK